MQVRKPGASRKVKACHGPSPLAGDGRVAPLCLRPGFQISERTDCISHAARLEGICCVGFIPERRLSVPSPLQHELPGLAVGRRLMFVSDVFAREHTQDMSLQNYNLVLFCNTWCHQTPWLRTGLKEVLS
jgi:hypothetical protein